MIKEVKIKSCSLKDISLLMEIGETTFHETYINIVSEQDMLAYLKKTFSHEQLEREIKDKKSRFFLIQYNNQIIGYMKLNLTKLPDIGNALEIERMYLLEEYKGKHMGKKLMEKAIELAKANNISYIWLGVWETNTKAILFYEKCGFIKYGTHLFTFGKEGHTDILMRLRI